MHLRADPRQTPTYRGARTSGGAARAHETFVLRSAPALHRCRAAFGAVCPSGDQHSDISPPAPAQPSGTGRPGVPDRRGGESKGLTRGTLVEDADIAANWLTLLESQLALGQLGERQAGALSGLAHVVRTMR